MFGRGLRDEESIELESIVFYINSIYSRGYFVIGVGNGRCPSKQGEKNRDREER